MTTSSQIKTVKIAYFSGTGSTARVADTFESELTRRGISVIKSEIKQGNICSDEKEDLLILLYAVHACNAPKIVYQWIDSLDGKKQTPVAVISVSGGGEITPNTACRLSSIRKLEKKNYKVFYEKMIVMPSNWIIKTDDGLAIRLVDILPLKVKHIVDDLLKGVICRTKPKLIDRVFSRIGEMEKNGAKFFGRNLRVNTNCNSCGWCAKNCSANNIIMMDDKPAFGEKCILCLKCIYGCPRQALEAGTLKFIIIKEGYNLKDLENRMQGIQLAPVEDLAKGYIWKGVKEYLLED
ncbi:EFR1 family ferrodoxin [uncultured Methanomethylovorans sp.]|uniref:EFR1 family ferrodoxin n=1 Tax=uncultured Methanomethylovorans sp. TaxID=183759 RepID=UPI002AA6F6C8|nr:EFR1 family ferrodoxin [uncultured Methanomethylovorans sp.]